MPALRKVPLHTLLYPLSLTQVDTHLQDLLIMCLLVGKQIEDKDGRGRRGQDLGQAHDLAGGGEHKHASAEEVVGDAVQQTRARTGCSQTRSASRGCWLAS